MENIVRQCLNCGKELTRRIGKEPVEKFRARKFCDRPCRSLYENVHGPLGGAKKGVLSQTRRAFADRARRFLRDACEDCGTRDDLTIHHEDRDWKNNDPANLRTLCRSCHSLHHHRKQEIGRRGSKPPCRVCGSTYDRHAGSRGDLCNAHRLRVARHGGIENMRRPKPTPPCRICGKPAAVKKRALCWGHYLHERRNT